ncbi:NADP-dependent oxidoreductase [Solwaraspora sp. WMMA2056]|uniref:NADP-dependent oxidoreductase n=1 Tax=Solwaraspora sp. WMMA2056 TaxID=3015161 RepID=UPI00259BC9B2|nr:NADP-dependent oxidoreductase [Solwaraspora sp. WMMA2056]WJK40719.1 NADP-dependent oxidoreductase [Solwaraspora sp. WMMA2056]
MWAAVFRRYGGPEVLEWGQVDTPDAGPGEVRVRVRAAGVQPIDCAVRAGFTPVWLKSRLPAVPGNEFAGVVDQVGADVTGIAVGDEVLGFGFMNAAAEFVVVPADQVTAKPAGMTWEVAGGFSGAAQTAHIALEIIRPVAGETLLVHGAAGAVGAVAVQLAVDAEARVVGTASAANRDYLRSLGAVPVDYRLGLTEQLRTLLPDGADAVLDGAGGAALDLSLDLCADRSRILTLVDHDRAAELGIRTTENLRSADRLAALAARYATGDLRFLIRRAYPMAQAADAHREVERRHGRGKVVLVA